MLARFDLNFNLVYLVRSHRYNNFSPPLIKKEEKKPSVVVTGAGETGLNLVYRFVFDSLLPQGQPSRLKHH